MLDLTERYPLQIDDSDPNFPLGKARNRTAPGDGTGTPWEEDLINDILGWKQALLADTGVSASGSVEQVGASDILNALKKLAQSPVVATFTFAGGSIADDGYLTPVLDLNSVGFATGSSFGAPYAETPLPGTYRVDLSLHMTDATDTPTIRLINYNAFGGTYNSTLDLLSAQRDTNVYTIKDHAIHSMTGLTTIQGAIALQNVSGHSISLHSTSRITISRIGGVISP